ncbi:MAG: retroviral-like aspartic protease family protein [Bacteroidales bacterium]|nr:retroviral-like aspartic protease family protein [Bacteroidales bacterium]
MKKLFIVLAACSLFACNPSDPPKPLNEEEVISSITETVVHNEDTRSVTVPFKEENGIKFIKVSIGGYDFSLVFDSGSSSSSITVAEANFLYNKGIISDEDIIGSASVRVADGSIVETMQVNLKNLNIKGLNGETIPCPDVLVNVVENQDAPLILGNSVLDRVASYSVDNNSGVIYFYLN